jgi:hypothetical protein
MGNRPDMISVTARLAIVLQRRCDWETEPLDRRISVYLGSGKGT